MKKEKFAALLAVFSIVLTGCNTTTNPPITDTYDDTSLYTEDTLYTEDISVPPVTGDTITEPSEQTTEPQTGDSTDDSQTTAPDEETETTESETSASTQAPVVTDPPVVTTKAPVVTTQAPVVTTAAPPVVTQPDDTPSAPTIYSNKASGTLTNGNKLATVDYSNTSDGYVMAKYTGSVSLIKVQVTGPNGVTQTYTLSSDGSYGSFPLTGGNGSYLINILENVSGNGYAVAHSFTFNASVSNSLSTYLRPNNYVNFDINNVAVKKASEICGSKMTDLEKVNQIYSWLVDNVSYDYDRASSVKGGALPDMNRVINNKKGICLDYAGTAVAMLRSQNIPTKMVVGYAGPQYHAWIEVYITGTGWVHGDVYFDGSGWKRMDPTYAATSKSSKSILDYIANNSNYRTDYLY